MESWLSLQNAPPAPSKDDMRNDSQAYIALFSEECSQEITKLYDEVLQQMRGIPYANSEDLLKCLSFLQEVVASALWKHHCSVPSSLAAFAREFDRLDVEDERKRLYDRAQTS